MRIKTEKLSPSNERRVCFPELLLRAPSDARPMAHSECFLTYIFLFFCRKCLPRYFRQLLLILLFPRNTFQSSTNSCESRKSTNNSITTSDVDDKTARVAEDLSSLSPVANVHVSPPNRLFLFLCKKEKKTT